MEPMIEYLFGTGDGPTTTWHSPADADLDSDGTLDAVRLDFDGDGRDDDLLADLDGDGVADVAGLDLDDDGVIDHFYRDSGRGLWEVEVDRATLGIDEPVTPDRRPAPTPDTGTRKPPPSSPSAPVPRGPGAPTDPGAVRVLDTDGDGRADAELVAVAGRGVRLYLDTDADGTLDTVLVDTDRDGAADVVYRRGAPEFRRP
ncbi:hypothetical protein GCM10009624_35480 [Gordonia sinesedis]